MRFKGFGAVAAVFLVPSSAMPNDALSTVDSAEDCPVTVGTDELLSPGSRSIYGSEALSVGLPAHGTSQVTSPGGRIALKLFWSSPGFRPGMQENLKVEVKNLHEGPNDAVVKDVTTANSVPDDFEKAQHDDEWLEGWTMLTGIDFPSPDCWEITGKYLDQSLTFVIQTVEHPR